MLKKIAIGLVVLIVILGASAHYLWSNLDHYIKVAIEKYGSEATQTTVSLDSVKLSLASGEGSIGGLTVTNPKGFDSSLKAFYLGSVQMKVDTSSIRGNGPIVISQIVIEKPQVNYEVTNGGDSNLQTIQRNAMDYANKMTGGKPGKAAPKTDASAPPTDKSGGRKVIITDLVVRDGQIGIAAQALQGKNLSAPLPEIHLTNIGKNSNGATGAEVAQQLLSAITTSASKVASSQLIQQLGGQFKNLTGSVGDKVNGAVGGKVGDEVKGLFGN